jgi:Zn-dependent protease
MRASYRVGRFFGVDVFVHITFLLFLVVMAWMGWRSALPGESRQMAAVASVLLIVALFVCVVLHEYGHILTARKFGIGTRDILLLPIGGVARLERIPERNREEILVALAGPAVNVVIAGVLYAFLRVADFSGAREFMENQHQWMRSLLGKDFWQTLMQLNLIMIVFNMIPAFPMDGGRVLRALLGMAVGREKATRLAARVGRVLAVIMGLVAMHYGHHVLVLTAVMVWVGAGREAAETVRQSTLRRYTAEQVMLRHFQAFRPEQRLSELLEAADQTWQQDFPLLDGPTEALCGVVLRRRWMAMSRDGAEHHVPLAVIGQSNCLAVEPHTNLAEVEELMQAQQCPLICVLRDTELQGIIFPELIVKFLLLREAGVPAR